MESKSENLIKLTDFHSDTGLVNLLSLNILKTKPG